MSKRIRYKFDGSNNMVLVSVRALRAVDGVEYFVRLTPIDGVFSVVNAVSGAMVAEGKAMSMAGLKIKAKKALEGLGVAFDKETRLSGMDNVG